MRPLYVRLPDEAADKLDRAAFELKTPKQNLVAQLVSNHLTVGKAEFFPNDGLAVLTLDEAAELLRVDPKQMQKLAANGEVPGRKVGAEWRFSRTGLLNWLSGNDEET
jgi:excisionase family DNA binding protein